jgi:uncharacterized glyoxalase superfamily protein PhnB
MSIRTVTHINFQGQARAALSFYHSVFGGQQTLVTMPMPIMSRIRSMQIASRGAR